MDLHDPVHKKVIGVSFIVFSVFGLVAVYFYDIFMDFILTQASKEPEFDAEMVWVFDLMERVVWALAIIFLIPRIIIGAALLTRQRWARIPALIYGVISMLNFPIGTALGIYCILVFTSKKSNENPFEERPF